MECPGCKGDVASLIYVYDQQIAKIDEFVSPGELFRIYGATFCADCTGYCDICNATYRDIVRHNHKHETGKAHA